MILKRSSLPQTVFFTKLSRFRNDLAYQKEWLIELQILFELLAPPLIVASEARKVLTHGVGSWLHPQIKTWLSWAKHSSSFLAQRLGKEKKVL
jgi:hypothetical protein